MATTHFSIPRFYGAKYGSADNLVQLGCAAEAVNIDTSDGALQTIVGGVPYPEQIDAEGVTLHFDPSRMWEGDDGAMYFLDGDKIIKVEATEPGASGILTSASIAWEPEEDPEATFMLTHIDYIVRIVLDGVTAIIGLSYKYDALGAEGNPGPVLIAMWDTDHYFFAIEWFGTGMFLTSDAITSVLTDSDSKITGVVIGRTMSTQDVPFYLDEKARCEYAGVYIMEHENDKSDFTAAYVSECQLGTNQTTIIFEDPLPAGSVSVGHYVKVRGGLSNQPVSFMTMHFGRLFAAGDYNFPNRLYWSCLPGDYRDVGDWTADDASPDTGGGYVQVGDTGYISALVSYQSQLLIWKGDELWRLYGALPSQFTLERVYKGAGQRHLIPPVDEFYRVIMRERIADVHGVPYVLLDEGLYYYDGSGLTRADGDRTLMAYLQSRAGMPVQDYGSDSSREISQIRDVCFWHGRLYFAVGDSYSAFWVNDGRLVSYDLGSGTVLETAYEGRIGATRQGVLVGEGPGLSLLLDGLSITDPLLDDIEYDEWLEHDPRWETHYHYIPDYFGNPQPINAVWESKDLTFGEVSYTKKLRRIGMDITGPVRVIVKSPECTLHDAVYDTTDIRARRFLWIPVDMPYECSFRIRFESVDGHPFRVHNGVDFYIETNQRN